MTETSLLYEHALLSPQFYDEFSGFFFFRGGGEGAADFMSEVNE